MPPFQTSEAIRPATGYPGMMADMSEWQGISGFVTGTTSRPGHPVQYGPTDRTFAPLTDGVFAGILRAHITAAPNGVFAEDEMIAAADEGHIFVNPGSACTRGAPVFWDPAANDGEGGYGDAGETQIPGAEFLTSAVAADDVVIVNLRKMPGGVPAAPDDGGDGDG